jgi:hypothetical protein
LFLPPLLMAEIESIPRRGDDVLFFPGRRVKGVTPPLSGWSKLMPPLVAVAQRLGVSGRVHLHGLRRGFRTALSKLGVQTEVAERMIGHVERNRLLIIYNKDDRAEARADAARRFCDALEAAVAKVEAELAAAGESGVVTNIAAARGRTPKAA